MENMDLSILSTPINEMDSIISTQNNDDSESKFDAPKKSFPTDVLKWMKANAKPKMALKLMQICKYFKHKEFPYFVIKFFYAYSKSFSYLDLNDVCHEMGNIANIANNLWIADEIDISQFREWPFNVSLLTSKIVFCDAKKIQLFDLEISFNDFKILTSSENVRQLVCQGTRICNESIEIVPLEDILACVPKIESICFCFHYYCLDTANKDIPSFSTIDAAKKEWILPNLKELEFRYIDEKFNVAAFLEFMKNHKSVVFDLCFRSNDSAQRLQLQAFVDEIIASADLRYPPPYIKFPLQTEASKTALEALIRTFKQISRSYFTSYMR